VAFLFDCGPASWTSREDLHLAVFRALLDRGRQPVIVLSETAPAIRAVYERAGVIVEQLNYRNGSVRYFLRMRQIFSEYHVDTVDIEFFCYFHPIAWMARINGVKNVVFTESNSGSMKATAWRAVLLRVRASLATAPVKRFVAISDYIRRQMLLLGIDHSAISVVHKGIDLRRYAPNHEIGRELRDLYGIQSDTIILGTVTILRAFKHPEVILEACMLLERRNVAFRLFVAGGGELEGEMKALADRLGIARRIHWLGYVQQPERFMRGWDLFLLASEGEAFGFVLIEAMSCGVPVVASASGAIPEVVAQGITGMLTPAGDASAMADAVEALARDQALRRGIAEASVARVREMFSIESAVQKTLQVYESLWNADTRVAGLVSKHE
jgi:glycosyltransferase involved in cell wall biosynthesis